MERDISFEFYAQVVKRALLQIKSVLEPSDKVEKDLQTINLWLLKQCAPNNFNGSDSKNIIIEQERSFVATCNVLEELGTDSPEQLSAFLFYSKINYHKSKKRNDKNN